MRSMNCRSVRNEIDEANPGDSLSSIVNDHLKNCAECESVSREHLKLREIVSSLGTVEAPGDFEFRLRARLANEKRSGNQPFVIRNMRFGVRSAAFATILFMIGSALLFVSLRTPSDDSISASNRTRPSSAVNETANHRDSGPQTVAPAIAPDGLTPASVLPPDVKPTGIAHRDIKTRDKVKSTELASTRDNGSLRARDLSSTGAETVKQPDQIVGSYPTFAIPIGASYQSLTVSLDNGRGTSRTISLPSVSFGWQQALSKNAGPLLTSARESW